MGGAHDQEKCRKKEREQKKMKRLKSEVVIPKKPDGARDTAQRPVATYKKEQDEV